jgi:hypothetical protein
MKIMTNLNHFALLCSLAFFTVPSLAQETWRGLVVQPENRCTPYNKKKQYPYSQSVEDKIVAQMGGYIYGPYTGRYFKTDTETDIEHIVAASEGHDSGLCSASKEKQVQFATDLLNLTLAAPEINRCGAEGKCGLDAAEWMPERNKCWFANRIVDIKAKYKLSVDQVEADTLEAVLSVCDSVEMVFFPITEQSATITPTTPTPTPSSVNALTIYDDNGNGRITCSEARAHGITPVNQEHPAYEFMNDRDGDGVVC